MLLARAAADCGCRALDGRVPRRRAQPPALNRPTHPSLPLGRPSSARASSGAACSCCGARSWWRRTCASATWLPGKHAAASQRVGGVVQRPALPLPGRQVGARRAPGCETGVRGWRACSARTRASRALPLPGRQVGGGCSDEGGGAAPLPVHGLVLWQGGSLLFGDFAPARRRPPAPPAGAWWSAASGRSACRCGGALDERCKSGGRDLHAAHPFANHAAGWQGQH